MYFGVSTSSVSQSIDACLLSHKPKAWLLFKGKKKGTANIQMLFTCVVCVSGCAINKPNMTVTAKEETMEKVNESYPSLNDKSRCCTRLDYNASFLLLIRAQSSLCPLPPARHKQIWSRENGMGKKMDKKHDCLSACSGSNTKSMAKVNTYLTQCS